MTAVPETQYAKTEDGVHIAYQVSGAGPIDLVWVPGYFSHIETEWEEPRYARFFHRLGSFARLIRFDKRGTGLSDRTGENHLQRWVDDTLAVMNATGSERAAVLGLSGGGPIAIMFAATYPERTSGLVILESYARYRKADDYPIGFTDEEAEFRRELAVSQWGSFDQPAAPSIGDDPRIRAWFHKRQRLAASPGAIDAVLRTLLALDVRPALSAITVPTLIIHCVGDQMVPVEAGRYLAEHIKGSKYVELAGVDHVPHFEHADVVLAELQEFLTGSPPAPETERVLATILFTDIVSSTPRNLEVGDRRWRELLDEHDSAVRREVKRWSGRLVKSTGDGVLAIFDGPARAVRCGSAIRDDAGSRGLELRVGLHTGELELRGEDVSGIAVNIAERVCSLAGSGEVLVSRTVVDLVVGSGIEFLDRGEQELKGVPGSWQLFAAG